MKAAGKADAAMARLVVVAVDLRNAIKSDFCSLLLIFLSTFVNETGKIREQLKKEYSFWENSWKFLEISIILRGLFWNFILSIVIFLEKIIDILFSYNNKQV